MPFWPNGQARLNMENRGMQQDILPWKTQEWHMWVLQLSNRRRRNGIIPATPELEGRREDEKHE
jgi:hypothetical protein